MRIRLLLITVLTVSLTLASLYPLPLVEAGCRSVGNVGFFGQEGVFQISAGMVQISEALDQSPDTASFLTQANCPGCCNPVTCCGDDGPVVLCTVNATDNGGTVFFQKQAAEIFNVVPGAHVKVAIRWNNTRPDGGQQKTDRFYTFTVPAWTGQIQAVSFIGNIFTCP